MKKLSKILILSFLAVFLVAGSALAVPFNDRPWAPPTGNLQPLQDIFTDIGSSIDVDNDQSNAAIFNPTGFGVSSAAFIAQVTWDQSIPGAGIEFGLYEYGNPSNTVTVIPGGVSPLFRSSITFDFVAGTVTAVNADDNTEIIGQADFTNPFGFYTYTDWASAGYQYSEDDLNNGAVQQLIYEAKGDNVSLPFEGPLFTLNDTGHWYVATEALNVTSAGSFTEGGLDFNDMVVMLESVEPVPEPATMLLLGSGLIGLAGLGRKKFFKKS